MREIADRLPKDALDQVTKLSIETNGRELQEQLSDLYFGISALLVKNKIRIDGEKSSCRLKTQGRIQDKIERRGSYDLVLDIHGLRFVVDTVEDKYKVLSVISRFYVIPESLGGKSGIRDYSKKEDRDFQRENFNPNITDDYTALHVNILFGHWESPEVAEIQIMTQEEFVLAEKSRGKYLNSQMQMSSSRSR